MSNHINQSSVQHIFIIGAKSIGQYGGYETFVDKLTEQHECDSSIKYHVACKANGDGFMDETKLSPITVVKTTDLGEVTEFSYHNAHVFKIKCPSIGSAVALYYDRAALKYSIQYCKDNHIQHPIFYVLTCRIGLFINHLNKQIHDIGGTYMVNPDGHEWLRAKWSAPVRRYWKWSEKKMVTSADIVICDSINIEKYIQEEYHHPNTTFIAYGADVTPSTLSDDAPVFQNWIKEKGLKPEQYYLVVGRFVPENNYETMIREFMKSNTRKDFAIITNMNDQLKAHLESTLHFSSDPRIKFVGTVYDKELLKKIREKAYAYFHGHEVGGTNPSLLEALSSTKLNLLLDVGFNREVGQNAAFYWTKESTNLSKLIEATDNINSITRDEYGQRAKARIQTAYSWQYIGDKYKKLWINQNSRSKQKESEY